MDMKHLKYLLAAMLPFAFAACDKDDEPAFVPGLEFATDKLSADAGGGILSVDVKADMPYEVIMPQEAAWVKLEGEAQPQAATLSFEVEKNTAATARTAAVVIRASEGIALADTLRITQSGIDDAADITAEFDPAFAAALQEFEYITDSRHITPADVKGITVLDVSGTYEDYVEGKGLTSLKGIEYFTALEYLACSRNQLTALDVSKNTALNTLYCYRNQLTALDVSKNTALNILYCYGNQLTALDVSKNTALTKLYCYENQLTSLDVSRNTALTDLGCDENQLTVLDLSRNVALTLLFCYENQLISLDVSQNTALKYFACYNNPGLDGIFEVTLWPGSELTAWIESWEYNGQTVTVEYTGK